MHPFIHTCFQSLIQQLCWNPYGSPYIRTTLEPYIRNTAYQLPFSALGGANITCDLAD